MLLNTLVARFWQLNYLTTLPIRLVIENIRYQFTNCKILKFTKRQVYNKELLFKRKNYVIETENGRIGDNYT